MLHVCSAMESIPVIKALDKRRCHPAMMLFYNPNIQPEDEYCRHRDSLAFMISRMDVFFGDGRGPVGWEFAGYKPKEFFQEIGGKGFSKERCRLCYRMRLRKTARFARDLKYGCFSTTLLSSRRQDLDVIREEGERAGKEFGLKFISLDMAPGRKKARSLANEYGLHIGRRCGCIFDDAQNVTVFGLREDDDPEDGGGGEGGEGDG
jgi:predicted adenine nucleotide alpha hydrolase (AANH) superfamily ATPase